MNPIDELANSFMKFPGIGRRQAKRFAYFIIQSKPHYISKLLSQIENIHKHIRLDPNSFQYFYSTDPSDTTSPIMKDSTRNSKLLMIVEKDVDIESIEKSRAYHGHYFVLGGLAPLVDTDLEQTIRVNELIKRVEAKATAQDLDEIIFALAAHPEGDRTARLVRQKLEPLREHYGFTISQLGRGFSTGTEVEYSDPETLASALENRK